jgi:hypothetical protein
LTCSSTKLILQIGILEATMDVRRDLERSLTASCDAMKWESSFSAGAEAVGNLGLSLLSMLGDTFTGPVQEERPESSR